MKTFQGETGMFQQTYDNNQERKKHSLSIFLKCNSRPGNTQTYVTKTHGQPIHGQTK